MNTFERSQQPENSEGDGPKRVGDVEKAEEMAYVGESGREELSTAARHRHEVLTEDYGDEYAEAYHSAMTGAKKMSAEELEEARKQSWLRYEELRLIRPGGAMTSEDHKNPEGKKYQHLIKEYQAIGNLNGFEDELERRGTKE